MLDAVFFKKKKKKTFELKKKKKSGQLHAVYVKKSSILLGH